MHQDKLRTALLGASGRMGRLLTQCLLETPQFELVAAVDLQKPRQNVEALPFFQSLDEAPDFDLLIDFSLPAASLAARATMRQRKAAYLLASTGFQPEEYAQMQSLATLLPLMIAANCSLGIALMRQLSQIAAKALSDWDCELLETHHRHKRDAPSGTALSLAQSIALAQGQTKAELILDRANHAQARPNGAIAISSMRGGTVAGSHSALWLGPHEQLEIKHVAEDRKIFAYGALKLGLWLSQQAPGLYQVDDYFQLKQIVPPALQNKAL